MAVFSSWILRDGAPSRVLGQLLAWFSETGLRQGRGLVLRQAALLILVAAAARAEIMSGLGHCGQHLRAEKDASLYRDLLTDATFHQLLLACDRDLADTAGVPGASDAAALFILLTIGASRVADPAASGVSATGASAFAARSMAAGRGRRRRRCASSAPSVTGGARFRVKLAEKTAP